MLTRRCHRSPRCGRAGTSEQFLVQAFGPHGALHSCKVKRDPSTGLCSGVGFVNFSERDAALRAIAALDGAALSTGGRLSVQLQAPRSQRAATAAVYRAAMQPPGPATTPSHAPHHRQLGDSQPLAAHGAWPVAAAAVAQPSPAALGAVAFSPVLVPMAQGGYVLVTTHHVAAPAVAGAPLAALFSTPHAFV